MGELVNGYMKQLRVDGSGVYQVIHIAAENAEALAVKRDLYLSDAWEDATQEEFDAQFNARVGGENDAKQEGAEEKKSEDQGTGAENTGEEKGTEEKTDGEVKTAPANEA